MGHSKSPKASSVLPWARSPTRTIRRGIRPAFSEASATSSIAATTVDQAERPRSVAVHVGSSASSRASRATAGSLRSVVERVRLGEGQERSCRWRRRRRRRAGRRACGRRRSPCQGEGLGPGPRGRPSAEARARVDQDEQSRRPLDVAEVEARGLAEERPGEGEGQQGQGRGPEQEQPGGCRGGSGGSGEGGVGVRNISELNGTSPLGGPADQVEAGSARRSPGHRGGRRASGSSSRRPPAPARRCDGSAIRPRRIRALRRSKRTTLEGRSVADLLELDPQVGAGLGFTCGRRARRTGGGTRPRASVGVDVELAAGLDVAEHRGVGEREVDLGRVEHAEDDDVMAPRLEVAQPGLEGVESGPGGRRSGRSARACGPWRRSLRAAGVRSVACPCGLVFEHPHQAAELARPMARREVAR